MKVVRLVKNTKQTKNMMHDSLKYILLDKLFVSDNYVYYKACIFCVHVFFMDFAEIHVPKNFTQFY